MPIFEVEHVHSDAFSFTRHRCMPTYNISVCIYIPKTRNHTHINTYIHTYVRTYVHTYIHTYIHTHINTYIHTYIHRYICGPSLDKHNIGILSVQKHPAKTDSTKQSSLALGLHTCVLLDHFICTSAPKCMSEIFNSGIDDYEHIYITQYAFLLHVCACVGLDNNILYIDQPCVPSIQCSAFCRCGHVLVPAERFALI